MPVETELKLQLEPDAIPFLEASDLLGKAAPMVRQRSLYFDTPDQKLRAQAMSLRIRRAGRSRTQTLKGCEGQAAGLFERSEWEMPVKDDQPKVEGLKPLIDALGKEVNGLGVIFEVRNERRTWHLRSGGSDVELVLDHGAAVVAGRTSAINEMELELKSGQPADLFRLARQIDAIVPVRLGVQSKAERGYDLLGPARTAFKAEALSLAKDASVADAFRAIVHGCLRQYRLNETLFLEAPNPAALHQARVGLRRLRSAFTIFKPVLERARAERFKTRLRDLSAVLGDARNLDVLKEKPLPPAALSRIEEARQAAYEKVERRLHAAESRALMLDLIEWLGEDGWFANHELADRPAIGFAEDRLGRLRRRIKKDGRHLARGSDSERHEVRKDAKKLRYASEFFAHLFDTPKQQRRHGKFLKTMEKLQDDLGALNDLATADEIIDKLGIDKSSTQHIHADRHALIRHASKAWQDLIDLKRFWR